jgi:hypothetical protein
MFMKYPRTPHLAGSKLQPGDSDQDQIHMASLTQGNLVWEEKVDGGNTGVSFDAQGQLQLQSRGHVLVGGAREAQFNLFKQWCTGREEDLYIVLGDQYIMYGEWCYAKHTVWYDALPHYFLEFDVYDKINHKWLDTPSRHTLLKPLHVHHVPVLHEGHLRNRSQVEQLITRSLFKTADWRESFEQHVMKLGMDVTRVWAETEPSDLSEGLYIKQELNGEVIGRYKFVRYDFVQTILDSGTHWSTRPIIPNLLAPGHSLFGDVS